MAPKMTYWPLNKAHTCGASSYKEAHRFTFPKALRSIDLLVRKAYRGQHAGESGWSGAGTEVAGAVSSQCWRKSIPIRPTALMSEKAEVPKTMEKLQASLPNLQAKSSPLQVITSWGWGGVKIEMIVLLHFAGIVQKTSQQDHKQYSSACNAGLQQSTPAPGQQPFLNHD